MTRLHDGARQTMAWFHGWVALLLGHLLYLIAIAGTLSVFRAEIGRWMRPETTERADAARALTAAAGWLSRHAPDATAWYLTLPDARTNTVDGYYTHAGDLLFRALDPVTGAPAVRETLGGEFFYRLHFELQLPYPWGRMLAALAAAMMLVALISGVVAHRRFFRDFFLFRPKKGQRSWLDGHNVLGVLALPFHLMITLTGLLTLASLVMPWGGVGAYGNDTAAMYRDLSPALVSRPASGRKAPLASLAPMVAEAQRRCGGAVRQATVEHAGDAMATVTLFCSDDAQIASNRGEVSFAGATGRVIAAWIEHRPAVDAYYVLYGLHMARFAPGLLRWFYFVGGIALAAVIATGLVLWTEKRALRDNGLGNRLLARVNAGVMTGVPIGAVAFLLANRLLPLGLAERGAVEVRVALVSGVIAIVAGASLPARWRWLVPAAVLVLLAVLSPWIGGGAGVLATAWRHGDGAILGVDAVLLAVALAAAWVVRVQWRRAQ